MTSEQRQAEKAAATDKQRYVKVRVTGDRGPSVVCTQKEADEMIADDPSLEVWAEVWMTQRGYERLPDFDGF